MTINWKRVDEKEQIQKELDSVCGCEVVPEFSDNVLKTITFFEDDGNPLLRLWYESYGGIHVQKPEPRETVPAILLILSKLKYTADTTIVFDRDGSSWEKQEQYKKALRALLSEADDFIEHSVRLDFYDFDAITYFNDNPEEEVYQKDNDGWRITAQYMELFKDSITEEAKPKKPRF